MVLGAIVPDWLGVVGVIVGVGAALGFLIGWTRTNMSKGTIELYAANNEGLHQQNELQQIQLDKQATIIEGLQKQVAAQQGQIDTLKDLASGKKAVDELALVLADRHVEVMRAIVKGSAA